MRGRAVLVLLTCRVIIEYSGGDNVATVEELALQLLLRHALGQAADVQIGAFNALAAGPGVRHLQRASERTRGRDVAWRARAADGASQREKKITQQSKSHDSWHTK